MHAIRLGSLPTSDERGMTTTRARVPTTARWRCADSAKRDAETVEPRNGVTWGCCGGPALLRRSVDAAADKRKGAMACGLARSDGAAAAEHKAKLGAGRGHQGQALGEEPAQGRPWR
jgi:hypothetical protein